MNEEEKQRYKESYAQKKAHGIKFYPDAVYKDLLVSFGIFILLVILAAFIGVANEPKADPSDSAYIPRPEWYFMFLFEMLKFFPGKIEWIGAALIPGIVVLTLLVLPFIDRNPRRHFSKRKFAISIMTIVVIGMIGLTISAVITTPPQEETEAVAATISEQILLGQDLFSIECVECHGADGEGGEIKGVEGLEGFMMKPINSQDEMYTRTDETLHNIIAMGQPDLGMPPSGKAFGGELSVSEVEAIVTFMRYTWDDRAEIPADVAQASAIPALGPNEVPSYEVHIAPLIKRYCLSCHRPGKKNNNYFMSTYEEVMAGGDHAPNVIAGDLNSNMILMINRQEIEAGGPMPPTKALPEEVNRLFTLWVAGGAPNTAAEAATKTLPPEFAPPASAPSLTATPGGTPQAP